MSDDSPAVVYIAEHELLAPQWLHPKNLGKNGSNFCFARFIPRADGFERMENSR